MKEDEGRPAPSDSTPAASTGEAAVRRMMARGCLNAVLFTAGLVLLLPGLALTTCVMIADQQGFHMGLFSVLPLLIAFVIIGFGIFLIRAAVRRPCA